MFNFAVTLLQLGGWTLYAGIVGAVIMGVTFCVRKGLGEKGKSFLKAALGLVGIGIVFIVVALAIGGGWRALFVA